MTIQEGLKLALSIVFCVTVCWSDGTIEEFPQYRTYLEGSSGRYGKDNFALYNNDNDKMMISYNKVKWVKHGCS